MRLKWKPSEDNIRESSKSEMGKNSLGNFSQQGTAWHPGTKGRERLFRLQWIHSTFLFGLVYFLMHRNNSVCGNSCLACSPSIGVSVSPGILNKWIIHFVYHICSPHCWAAFPSMLLEEKERVLSFWKEKKGKISWVQLVILLLLAGLTWLTLSSFELLLKKCCTGLTVNVLLFICDLESWPHEQVSAY